MTNEVKNVPELRFPEFEGEWEENVLGEVVIIKSGCSPSNFEKKDASVLLIKVDDLNYSSRMINNSKLKVNESNKYKKIKKDSIIFPKRGAAILTNKVRILGIDSYMDSNMMALEPKKINSEFLFTFIGKTGLYKIADTSTIPQINNKHIEPYNILLPSNTEQKYIGDFFSKLDRQIELEEQKLEKLEQQKKGYMQKIFSQELRFKDENGNEYPEWEVKLIKDILEFENNRRKPVTSTIREIGNYPYYGASGVIDYVKDYIFDNEIRLLIGEDGAKWGAFEESSFIATGRYWVNNHAHVAKSELSNLTFLNYWLNYKELRTYVTGNAPAKLTFNNLCMISILLPSIEEQKLIGDFFNKFDDFIEQQSNKVKILKERKKGFLQKMFV